MYYCITCSEIHHERGVTDKVFKNGFYIDPFLGERYHLGMCNDSNTNTLNKEKPENPQSIMKILPTFVIPT